MDNFTTHYTRLNSLQKEAVDTCEGALLVLAGPGTGKTQLLSVRAASILRKGIAQPENILILTYTNAAAKAMKERLARVIGSAGYDIEAGTFHSFANSILQGSTEAANYVGDRIPMTDVEQTKALEFIFDTTEGIDEIRPFRAPYIYLREVRQKISDLKKDGISPQALERYLSGPDSSYRDLEEKYIKRLLAFMRIYKRYEEIKACGTANLFDERGRYDFDDMILFAVEALKNEKGLVEDYRRQYTHVMVDEFQDTNGAQLELLFTLLAPGRANICCVGDDDQSIYRFQGASVANFKLLKGRYPEIKTIQLRDNYRSTPELIKLSRAIITMIPPQERVEDKRLASFRDYEQKETLFKELTTEEEELLYIVDKVRELRERIEKDTSLTKDERSRPYNNIAVLVRKRDQMLKIIDVFLQAGIPYATDGKEDISGEKRVRQLLDVLELAHIDPKDCEAKDSALYRVLTADYFEIPQADILRFIHAVNNKKKKDAGISILNELLGCLANNSEGKEEDRENDPKNYIPRRAILALGRLLRQAIDESVHKLLLDYVKDVDLFGYILREYSDNAILRIRQLRGIGSFINMVKADDMASPGMRLDEFLAELRTRINHNLPVQGNLVTLSQAGVRVYTAHGSKGLEFHSVIIPFCLQNRSWPMKATPDRIPLPFDLFATREKTNQKDTAKKLTLQDETRLFYVATTRAKSNLIFTASPSGDAVSTSYLANLDITKDASRDNADEEDILKRSLTVSDAEDPFIGTEAILSDMIDNLSLNPTRLNNYITCRRRFLYNDVLKLPGQKKKSLVFGNCVHKALEETYKQYKETGKFPGFVFFEKEFTRELRFQGADAAMTRECLNRMKTVKGWFTHTAGNAVIPIDLEKKLIVTVGDNIIFTGKYDKVEWDDREKGLVRIVDYKTGKPDNHIKAIDTCDDLGSRDCDGYLRQLVAYKLLFEKDKKESKGRKVKAGSLVFIEPLNADIKKSKLKKGDYITKTVAVSDEMVRQLETIINDSWRSIKALQFEKLTSREANTCGNCDFDTICWGAQ